MAPIITDRSIIRNESPTSCPKTVNSNRMEQVSDKRAGNSGRGKGKCDSRSVDIGRLTQTMEIWSELLEKNDMNESVGGSKVKTVVFPRQMFYNSEGRLNLNNVFQLSDVENK